MAIRLLLIGVVASLALELPGSPTWTRPCTSRYSDGPVAAGLAMPRGTDAFAVVVPEPRASELSPAVASVPAADPVQPVAPTAAVVAAAPIAPASETTPLTEVAAAPLDPMPAPAPEVVEAPAPMLVPMIVEARTSMIEVVDLEDLVPADPDAAFLAIVDEMATTFAADLAPPVAPMVPSPLVADGQIDDEGNDALELDPALPRLPGHEEKEASPAEANAAAESAEKPAPEPPAEPARSIRLEQAVRLTGEAMNAWASLLRLESNSRTLRR